MPKVRTSSQHKRRSAALFAALLLTGLTALRLTVGAQEVLPDPTARPLLADESEGFESPRSTMRGFLGAGRAGDWQRAASYLDLRGRKKEEGPKLARELKTILDRKLWIDLDGLSSALEGNTADAELQGRDLVGAFVRTNGDWAKIVVERLPGADGAREWRIARSTLQQVPDLWREFGDGPLSDRLPPVFFDLRVFDVQLWQFVALVLLVLAGLALSWLISAPIIHLLGVIVRRTVTRRDDRLLGIVAGPLRLALFVVLMSAGAYPINLPVLIQRRITGLLGGLLIVAATWFLVRFIDAGTRSMERRYSARGLLAARAALTLARRSLIAFVVLLTMLAVFQNLGFNVTGLVAGLGIGGLAVALAAQKSLEHFFGGLSLVADQPIRVGEVCSFGDRMGTVEDIGLRSTRIRTLERTIITIPNGEFSSMHIENFSRRDRMLVKTTLGLLYETTPDQLRWLLVELKALLLAHPKVSPDPARVSFANFGDWSLDVELFFLINTTDVNEFMAVRQELFLRIMDVVAASGSAFAFPTQVEYSAGATGMDRDRQKAAEEQVAAWRAERSLHEVPSRRAAELAESLGWPAISRGS